MRKLRRSLANYAELAAPAVVPVDVLGIPAGQVVGIAERLLQGDPSLRARYPEMRSSPVVPGSKRTNRP